MHFLERHKTVLDERVREWCDALPSSGLYEPMAYMMNMPSKRVRPNAMLLACELFGGEPLQCVDQAMAIELFHNFTLMHDDIMDRAPLRRGLETVHVKWDTNTAILSGDAMLVLVYDLIGTGHAEFKIFQQAALRVCEGQHLDMELERRTQVEVAEYMEMIRLKTAALLACSLRMGASLASAPLADQDRIGEFGEQLGLSFQLQDDLLDAFGDPAKVGKKRGGDLLVGKRTFLLIRGLEKSMGSGRTELQEELLKGPGARNVDRMIDVLDDLGIPKETRVEADRHYDAALVALEAIAVPDAKKKPLRDMAAQLLDRVN